MRRVMAAFAALSLACVDARAQDVPEGIRYSKAAADLNGRAEASLRAGLSAQPRRLAGLAEPGAKPFLAGLFLSRVLLDSGLVDAARFGKALYRVPLTKDIKPQSAGIVARDATERSVLDEALERWLPASREFVVRPLTADELALIWYYIGWDLTEPLFAVDIGARTLVVDFAEDGRSVVWLEDVSRPCSRFAWEGGALPDCYCSVVVRDGPRRRVMFRAQPPTGSGTCAGTSRPAP
jgi:hypothetical protein